MKALLASPKIASDGSKSCTAETIASAISGSRAAWL
jgi:hypothetical protein